MKTEINLFDTIALISDLPDNKLRKGQVGTIVEKLANNVYEVEFCDKNGQTILSTSIKTDKMLLLHYELIAA